MKETKILIFIGLVIFLANESPGQSLAKEKDSLSKSLAIADAKQKELIRKKGQLAEKQELSRKIRQEAFDKQIAYLKAQKDTLKRQLQHFEKEERAIRVQEEKELKQLELENAQDVKLQVQEEKGALQIELEKNYEQKLDTNISLDKEAEVKEIPLELEREVHALFWNVSSGISSGIISIELYDPNGVKQGDFSLNGPSRTRDRPHKDVHGSMNKQFKKPLTGQWKIRIIPRDAKGFVSIKAGIALEDLTRN